MNYEFETEIENASVTVSFEYSPEEKTITWQRDGSGYPGAPESIDHIEVTWVGQRFDSASGEYRNEPFEVSELLKELGYDLENICYEYLANK